MNPYRIPQVPTLPNKKSKLYIFLKRLKKKIIIKIFKFSLIKILMLIAFSIFMGYYFTNIWTNAYIKKNKDCVELIKQKNTNIKVIYKRR